MVFIYGYTEIRARAGHYKPMNFTLFVGKSTKKQTARCVNIDVPLFVSFARLSLLCFYSFRLCRARVPSRVWRWRLAVGSSGSSARLHQYSCSHNQSSRLGVSALGSDAGVNLRCAAGLLNLQGSVLQSYGRYCEKYKNISKLVGAFGHSGAHGLRTWDISDCGGVRSVHRHLQPQSAHASRRV
jgi:hypothetical protein